MLLACLSDCKWKQNGILLMIWAEVSIIHRKQSFRVGLQSYFIWIKSQCTTIKEGLHSFEQEDIGFKSAKGQTSILKKSILISDA